VYAIFESNQAEGGAILPAVSSGYLFPRDANAQEKQ
jgi:hypothetical protein